MPAGSYDNELLDLHYICGDGRCNENIGLTAIHQIFHMEHDRLVDYFYNDDGSTIPSSFGGVLAQPENAALLAEYKNLVNPVPNAFTFEQRLFQAARFVTEMQYQHLVFEEFARKVQPEINHLKHLLSAKLTLTQRLQRNLPMRFTVLVTRC